MFDAKSILDSLVNAGRHSGSSGVSGPHGDPLSDLLGGKGGLGDLLRGAVPQSGGAQSGQQGDPLSDLLGRLGGGAGSADSVGQAGGGLGDILGKLGGGSARGGDGRSITDVLGDLLNQAKDGTREGAQKIDQATGASDTLGDLARQFSGKSPEELMAALQDLVRNNKLGTGAALGGLGALILGSQTGRSIAVSAAKLGALALIGGLAYKAYRNYQSGQSADAAAEGDIDVPPAGSGFEPDAATNDDAMLMIRAMIGAAAADGRIDGDEQQKILDNLQSGGELGSDAEDFLARELNNPASAADLASSARNREQAAQIYAAARIAIDPDTAGEREFLADLAQRLDMDDALAAHIDAAARGA